MTVLRLISHVRSEVIPPQFKIIAGFVGTVQWLCHPGHRTSHRCNSFYGATWKPWLTHRQLILWRILKQQQAPGINLAFLIVGDDHCFVIISCLLKWMAVRRNIRSKLVRNSSFVILQWFCLTFILLMWRIWWTLINVSKWQMGINLAFKGLIFTHSQTHSDGHLHWQDARPAYSCLTILSFSPFFDLKKFGSGVFPHST
jgi:hypothetical protein